VDQLRSGHCCGQQPVHPTTVGHMGLGFGQWLLSSVLVEWVTCVVNPTPGHGRINLCDAYQVPLGQPSTGY